LNLVSLLVGLLRGGIVTRSYPTDIDVPDRRSRGTPVLNPKRCDASGVCVDVCPTDAISLSEASDPAGRRWTIDYGLCIFCGACIRACPENAIGASNGFELASARREATVARWAIGGEG
jgi:formate hydrogenlyase subunit 6/NADH:ubiquinone oxidoreductase subunit I